MKKYYLFFLFIASLCSASSIKAETSSVGLKDYYDAPEGLADISINVPVVGRFYKDSKLYCSTKSDPSTSSRYSVPTAAQKAHYYSDDFNKVDQGDWIILGNLDESYVNKEITGITGYKYFPLKKNPTSSTDKEGFSILNVFANANIETTQGVGSFTPNRYRVANFTQEDDNAKDLWLVTPQRGEYCQVSGMLWSKGRDICWFSSDSEQTNELRVDVSDLSDEEYNAMQYDKWYTVTGMVTIDIYYNWYVFKAFSVKDATTTSVGSVETEAADAYGIEGAIVVNSDNAAVDVYNMAGAKVANAQVNGTMAIASASGMYVVKVGNKAMKVVVK